MMLFYETIWAARTEPKQLVSTLMGLRFNHSFHVSSPRYNFQVSALFQSLMTPNNTYLEKASSYIPPMQLQMSSAARQIYK